MKKAQKRLLTLILALTIIFGGTFPSFAAPVAGKQAQINHVESFAEIENWARNKMNEISGKYTAETQGEGTKDWWKIAEMGKLNISAGTKDMDFLKSQVDEASDKVNIYTKSILALRGQKIDPENYYGINLVEELKNQNIKNRGLWSWAPAVSALATDDYGIDDYMQGEVTALLAERKTTGPNTNLWDVWGWSDASGFALYAIAPYYSQRQDVRDAVDEVVTALGDKKGNGDLINNNCNSLVMVLGGLASNDPNLIQDQRIAKNGYTLLHELKKYDIAGGFKWLYGDQKPNPMATEQAYRALVSYFQMKDNKKMVFDYRGTAKSIVGALVDKRQLQEKYNEVKNLEQGNYSQETWAVFLQARESAKAVLENTNASQEEVNTALANLTSAIEGLEEKISPELTEMRTKLQKLYKAVKNMEATPYTSETWGPFESARENAKTILDKPESTLQDLRQAHFNLFNAIINLKRGENISSETIMRRLEEFQKKVGRSLGIWGGFYTGDGESLVRDITKYPIDLGFTLNKETPEQVAQEVCDNDSNVVFLSLDSSTHISYVPRIVERLKLLGRDDIKVVVKKSNIKQEDIEYLNRWGISGIFDESADLKDILNKIIDEAYKSVE